MSNTCSICGKGSMLLTPRVKLRGKYNPVEKKRKYPNLQWMALPGGKRTRACAKCIKSQYKTKKK